MNFGDLLNKYGVKWEEKYISYTPWPYRNNQLLTGVVAHTEGPPYNIPGTDDRDPFNYFNNINNRANSNGFVCFSGKFLLYVPIDHGNWSNGNDNDNVQTFTIETQDNGRYNTASTYTDAQYRAWAGVYCALVEWSKLHPTKASEIFFNRSVRGLRGHNEISPGRACPGRLDLDRILREAKALYEQVNAPQSNPAPDKVSLLENKIKKIRALSEEILTVINS